jgi:hypothetical protein
MQRKEVALIMDREGYYQDLMKRYLKYGDEALEDFRGELRRLAGCRKDCLQRSEIRARSARLRWSVYDGEREEVLSTFLADIEVRKQLDLAEETVLKKTSKKATDAKYAPGRDQYAVALKVAEELWQSGDKRTHDKMLMHIVGKEGTPPGTLEQFHYLSKFDNNCGYTRNGLKEKLKELAYTINRDLVCGLKKNA